MRRKLTAQQKYNKEYYQAHKGEASFEARRRRNAKVYRAKASVKQRRNERIREKWATDPEYRLKISEYQKAWRQRRKLRLSNSSKKRIVRRKRI